MHLWPSSTLKQNTHIMENEATNIEFGISINPTGIFNFLEAIVKISNNEISTSHLNKNKDSIETQMKQKKFRYHNVDSFSPASQKQGTLIITKTGDSNLNNHSHVALLFFSDRHDRINKPHDKRA